MPDLRDLPPDPFDDDGIDPLAVEEAERLTRQETDPVDPRWDRIGGEPTIDDFDRAAHELGGCGDPSSARDLQDCGSGPFTKMTPWLSVIAVIIVIAMALTYVLR